MAEEYLDNPSLFRLYSLNEYLDFVVDVIERMNPEVYLERFVNQSPPEYLIAPNWGVKNYEFVAKLDKRLKEQKAPGISPSVFRKRSSVFPVSASVPGHESPDSGHNRKPPGNACCLCGS